MTDQFRDSFPDFGLEHSLETFHANLLEVRLAAPLTVEFRERADGRMLAQGQSVFTSHIEEARQQPRIAVDIAMRVEVSRRPRHEPAPSGKLILQCRPERSEI